MLLTGTGTGTSTSDVNAGMNTQGTRRHGTSARATPAGAPPMRHSPTWPWPPCKTGRTRDVWFVVIVVVGVVGIAACAGNK